MEDEAYLRVPEREADRFEALVRHAIDPSVHVPGTDNQVPPGEEHTAPEAVGSGRGLGPSAVDRLAGSEHVIDEIVHAVRQAEQALRQHLPGTAPPTGLDVHQLRTMLAETYSTEAMLKPKRARLLLGTRGLQITFEWPVPGGTATVTVTVRTRRRGPAVQGRADRIGVDLRRLGAGPDSAARPRGGIVAPGPVRTFDYPVSYDVTAEVQLGGRSETRPGSVPDGRVRYVVPKSMTDAAATSPVVAPEVITHEVSQPKRPWHGLGRPRTRTTRPTPPEPDQQATFGPDDLLLDLFGEDTLAEEVTSLLTEAGFDETRVRSQVQAGTAWERLVEQLLRDPDTAEPFEVTQSGPEGERSATVFLQPIPYREHPTGQVVPNLVRWTGARSDPGSRLQPAGTGGEMVRGPAPYGERVADVRWRVTVISEAGWRAGMPRPLAGTPGVFFREVLIHDGLPFLRPEPSTAARARARTGHVGRRRVAGRDGHRNSALPR